MIDDIVKAFKRYCETGEGSLTEEQQGYMKHCVAKAAYRGGHPIFMLMLLEGCDMSKLQTFLKGEMKCTSSSTARKLHR
jgi:hypothetical protein